MDDITLEGLNKAGYKYYAFISYNHKDERWAKGLQSKLRRYRLPSVARTEIGADVRINPVFRYKTNLPVAHLREQIKKELDRSKYLIVISSPNSAKPNIRGEHWVNDEVTRFINLGRADRIVPVIVDGVPNSGDERECFCPALRETEISAVNLVEGSRLDRKHEFLRLVAKLLGLEPMQLIREDDEERWRERLVRFLLLLPLGVLLAVGAVFFVDAQRTVTRYYRDYVDCYGLPEGIFRISEDEAKMRWRTYRFEYRGLYWNGVHKSSLPKSFCGVPRKLVRVCRVNPLGTPGDSQLLVDNGRPMIQEFQYDEDNRLRTIVVRKRGGKDFAGGPCQRKIVFTNRGSGNRVVINGRMFSTYENDIQVRCADASLTQRSRLDGLSSVSHITDYFIDRDGYGRMIAQSFRTGPSHDKITADANGVYGFAYELRANGQIAKTSYLSSDLRNRTSDKYGVAVESWIHDEQGNVVQIHHLTADGYPVLGRAGFIKNKMSFDTVGNITNEVIYNSRDLRAWRKIPEELVSNELGGSSRWCECSYAYSNGFCVARSSFRPDGAPLQGAGEAARIVWAYGNDGEEVSRTFYNARGDRMPVKDGYAHVTLEYDRQSGNCLTARFFDQDGRRSCDTKGRGGFDWEYDARGNPVFERCVDIGGNALVDDKLCPIRKYAFDENDRETWTASYDEHTNLCVDVSLGGNVAKVRFWYDDWGNAAWCRYYADEQCAVRAVNKDGSSGWHNVFDANGRIVESWGLGTDEVEGCMDTGRLGGSVTSYEDYNAPFELLPGIPVRAGWRGESTTWYVSPGVPSAPQGWCTRLQIRDDKGRIVIEAFKDAKGEFVVASDAGWAVCLTEWDSYGHSVAEYYYDDKGRPARTVKEEVFGRRSEYDRDSGEETKRWFVSADHKSRLCVKYEDYSEIRYENKDLQTARSYWHEGRPVRCREGYHRRVEKTNVFGDKTDDWCFDEQGKAVVGWFSDGYSYHHGYAEYNAYRQKTLVERRDTAGRPCALSGENFSALYNEYDNLHRLVAASFYLDWTNKVLGTEMNGIAKVSYQYEGRSRTAVRIEMTGSKDLPCLFGQTNVWRRIQLRDSWGNVTNESFWTVDNRPVGCWGDAALIISKYARIAGSSKLVEQCSYDGEGNEVADRSGAARTANEYSADGVKLRWEVFAPKGCGGVWGVASVHHVITRYDAVGRLVEKSFWDVNEDPTEGGGGCARCVYAFENGQTVAKQGYDAKGREVKTVGIAYVSEVYGGRQADMLGIKPGDVICRFGGYVIEKPDDFTPIPKAVSMTRESGSTVWLARKGDAGYVIFERHFRPGESMGVRIVDVDYAESEYQKILSAFSKAEE